MPRGISSWYLLVISVFITVYNNFDKVFTRIWPEFSVNNIYSNKYTNMEWQIDKDRNLLLYMYLTKILFFVGFI
jgi:hypothetical protein